MTLLMSIGAHILLTGTDYTLTKSRPQADPPNSRQGETAQEVQASTSYKSARLLLIRTCANFMSRSQGQRESDRR